MPSLNLSNISWPSSGPSWGTAYLNASFGGLYSLDYPNSRDSRSAHEERVDDSVVHVNISEPWFGPHGAWYATQLSLIPSAAIALDGDPASSLESGQRQMLPDINRLDYGLRPATSCTYSNDPFPQLDNGRAPIPQCSPKSSSPANNTASPYAQWLNIRFTDATPASLDDWEFAVTKSQEWRQPFSILPHNHDADWIGISPETVLQTAPDAGISVADSLASTKISDSYLNSSIYDIFKIDLHGGPFHRSWGYTAGSVKGNIPASLVIGGADRDRFILRDSKRFWMSKIPSQRFQITIQALNVTKSPSLPESESESVPVVKPDDDLQLATIDTTTSYLVLPPEVCTSMMNSLGGTTSNGTYLISADQHHLLSSSDTSITLVLAQLTQVRNVISDIHLSIPYQDLVWPLDPRNATEGTQVLAIKQASGAGRIVLGRVFLQRVHMMADYEEAQFVLNQAVPSEIHARRQLSTMDSIRRDLDLIFKPREPEVTYLQPEDKTFVPVMLGTLGVVFALTIVIGLPCCFWLRRRKRTKREAERAREEEMRRTVMEQIFDKPELAGGSRSFMESDSSLKHEVSNDSMKQELDDKRRSRVRVEEMEADVPIHELEAEHTARSSEADRKAAYDRDCP